MPKQKTVLLIDDEPSLLRLNTRVLEREGYYVLPARTLREARSLIKGVVLHAAVLDIELEDGSGLDFCRELRDPNSPLADNQPELYKIPIVLLTALREPENEKAGYDAGADEYITKPYRIERLRERLDKLLTLSAR